MTARDTDRKKQRQKEIAIQKEQKGRKEGRKEIKEGRKEIRKARNNE